MRYTALKCVEICCSNTYISYILRSIWNIKVVKINVDDQQDLAIKYGVMSIPTLVVIKNGQEVNRQVGLVSKDDILNLVK